MRWHKNAVYQRQKGLKENLLKDNNMDESKSVSTPMNTNSVHRNDDKGILYQKDVTKYSSSVGSLLYNAIKTRPDFCVATSLHGAGVERPCQMVLVADKRVLKYLRVTKAFL